MNLKIYRNWLLSVLLCAAAFSTVISVVPGCSTSAERKTFNTIYSVAESVDASYKSYLDLVTQGKVATNDVPRISGYYADFQRALGIAVAVEAANKNAPPTPELSSAANRVVSAISQAKGK